MEKISDKWGKKGRPKTPGMDDSETNETDQTLKEKKCTAIDRKCGHPMAEVE